MDKESKVTSAAQTFDPKRQRQRTASAEQRSTSSPPLVLPNPYVAHQISSGKPSGVSKSHGYSNSRRVRETKHDFQQRGRTKKDPQESKVNGDCPAQGRITGKSSLDAQKRGFRGAASATNVVGRPKPAQSDSSPFEVKMADFPELAGASQGTTRPPLIPNECWAPSPASKPQNQASMWKQFDNRGSSTQPDVQQSSHKPAFSAAPPSQPVVNSWASVASQPPKKPTPDEKSLSSSHIQTEETHEAEDPSKKKRRKKKKKNKCADEVDSEAMITYQEPPKFEDEEEFPGLTLTLTGPGRVTSSRGAAKLHNEETQKERDLDPFVDLDREKPLEAQMSAQTNKKAQNTEKVSGKKSKAPVQLDIGNMLAVLEKKQQSQRSKQDAKPVIFSVGGGLPVVQKQPSIQKKSPWQQDKIAHNPLDSTSPLVKKGKQREVPKAKKPTPLKKVILKEREERKHRRLLEERGLLPNEETKPLDDAAAQEQCDINTTEPSEEVISPAEEPEDLEFNGVNQVVNEESEEPDENQETMEQETTCPAPCAASQHKIHSRKFRDYCSQMLSKDIDECVTDLLKELVRFQDRLYQKDPMKARMKRRLVMGLREVLKHLKLRKVKCIIISPNCERIESRGGLDEALHTIIDLCREQGVPFVFALSRKALGRCVNKAVPVSVVGIFNYDGAQDCYHKMIELSCEARTAYEVMVTSQEKMGQVESEQAESTGEGPQSISRTKEADSSPRTQVEEPAYIKIWKKMLEKEYNHNILNFEEQLNSMHLDSECTENSDDEKG